MSSQKEKSKGNAVEEKVLPFVPYLHRMAFRLTGTQSEADDLVQELLIKLLERPALLDGVEYLKTWLVRCMHNLYIDGVRRNAKMVTLDQGELEDAIDADEGSSQPLLAPDKVADKEMLMKAIKQCLSCLSAEHRVVVVMHDMEGYQLPELSTQLDIPLGTLKSRLHRARAKLRLLLIEAGYGQGTATKNEQYAS